MMLDTRPPRVKAITSSRPFWREEGGATAVEFALLAFPFFGLIFAILQIALVLWSTQILENAVATAARQLYTGQFQTTPANAAQTASVLQGRFQKLVCDNVVGIFNCTDMVSVDVRVFGGFSGATVPPPVTNGVYDTSGYGYATPSRNDIAVVRASMEFPNYASLLMPGNVLKNGNQLIVASAAFRTEPF